MKKSQTNNWLKEQMRKKVTDKMNFKPVIHGRNMHRIIVAKLKRWSR